MRYGCLGIVGLAVLVAVISFLGSGARQQQATRGDSSGGTPNPAAATSTPTAERRLPTVGQTASSADWEVTLESYGPFEQFAKPSISTTAHGKLVVVEFGARNLRSGPFKFTTNDFSIQAASGRKFLPTGDTATIDKGMGGSQTVEPGAVSENRVVFDLDPQATGLVLHALRLQFQLPELPG